MSRVKGYRRLMQAIIISICLLVVVAACQNGVAQIANKNTLSLQNEAIATPSSTATAVTGQGMGILVPQQHGKIPTATATKGKSSATPTPTAQGGTGTSPGSGTATPNPGSGAGAPGAGTSNPVGVPAGFPNYFSFGVMSNPGEAPILDAMRSQNGTAYAFRYQYLTGGVNTGHGWETWNQPAGQYATNYMNESYQNGYIPAFAYYEICLSNGVNPGSYCGGHNLQQDTSNIDNPSTMNAYYANWALLMQRIGAFGHPVLVIVEPDFWGFMQNATNGSDNAADVPASVNSSGYPDAAGFPDTVQGFAWALLHMRDKYAPNAILALFFS